MFRVFLVAMLLASTSLAKAQSVPGGVVVTLTIDRHAAAVPLVKGSVYTAAAAAISIRKAGYRRIYFLQKKRDIYYFSAIKQRRIYWIAVTVRAGRIARAKPLR